MLGILIHIVLYTIVFESMYYFNSYSRRNMLQMRLLFIFVLTIVIADASALKQIPDWISSQDGIDIFLFHSILN